MRHNLHLWLCGPVEILVSDDSQIIDGGVSVIVKQLNVEGLRLHFSFVNVVVTCHESVHA